MMIIFLIFLIPAEIVCVPSLVKNEKSSKPSSQMHVYPSIAPDVLISKMQNHFDDNRTRRNAADLEIEPPIQWSYLRQYICGPTNPNCLKDESRLSKMRPDFLKKISKIATSNYDWAAKGFPILKEHFADADLWNSVNLSGRREGPLYVEEPNFVLVNGEEEYSNSDILQPFYRDDPFIPQRGRKSYDILKPTRNFNGMLTKTNENKNVRTSYYKNKKGNLFENTMTMTRQFKESKRSALLPIYDLCCSKELPISNPILKLCFVRCYDDEMKMDPTDNDYDSIFPQEVEII